MSDKTLNVSRVMAFGNEELNTIERVIQLAEMQIIEYRQAAIIANKHDEVEKADLFILKVERLKQSIWPGI